MSNNDSYTPPKVWQWDAENGGEWAKTNRPISGATHQQDLPVGEHALQLYSLATPNGQKVTIMLEELLELPLLWWMPSLMPLPLLLPCSLLFLFV